MSEAPGRHESPRRPVKTHFYVGSFHEPARLPPTRHVFLEERLPWLHTGDT